MQPAAKSLAKPRSNGGMWLDHATLVDSDFEWLCDVERLTLWNVKIPRGFLGRLKNLWWLDWRGGGLAQGIDQVADCSRLRFLALNQIRGLSDLSFLANSISLEMLTLYGLSRLEVLPSLKGLKSMRRLEIGQMKSLTQIAPALDAPNLEELSLHKFVGVSANDVKNINSHPKLRAFSWSVEDVPERIFGPVKNAITLPAVKTLHPEEWFGLP